MRGVLHYFYSASGFYKFMCPRPPHFLSASYAPVSNYTFFRRSCRKCIFFVSQMNSNLSILKKMYVVIPLSFVTLDFFSYMHYANLSCLTFFVIFEKYFVINQYNFVNYEKKILTLLKIILSSMQNILEKLKLNFFVK